jgi:hypothetical protein
MALTPSARKVLHLFTVAAAAAPAAGAAVVAVGKT